MCAESVSGLLLTCGVNVTVARVQSFYLLSFLFGVIVLPARSLSLISVFVCCYSNVNTYLLRQLPGSSTPCLSVVPPCVNCFSHVHASSDVYLVDSRFAVSLSLIIAMLAHYYCIRCQCNVSVLCSTCSSLLPKTSRQQHASAIGRPNCTVAAPSAPPLPWIRTRCLT